ncbi:hypothetical protein ACETKC_10065 [Brevundimonas intermedia]|nr:hypothetical protein [Brevundimonas intermedia]
MSDQREAAALARAAPLVALERAAVAVRAAMRFERSSALTIWG